MKFGSVTIDAVVKTSMMFVYEIIWANTDWSKDSGYLSKAFLVKK
jgi:hypothetical protein